MILDGFFRNILIRLVFICLSIFALGMIFPYLNSELYFTFIGIIILLILQLYFLANYIRKLNNKLTYVMDSINRNEIHFADKEKMGLNNEFKQSVENVRTLIQDQKIKHLQKDIYLENIITNVDIGLILFDENEEIDLLNPATKNLLKIEKLDTLQEIDKVSDGLADLIRNLNPSKPIDLKINIGNEILHLLFKASIFKIDEHTFKLISLQNIQEELERNELNSWQKLIKVFTHEIMNAVSPIASLANSLQKQLRSEIDEKKDFIILDKQMAGRTMDGLETVEDTSKGLLNFVSKYRDLTALPQPQIAEVNLSKYFEHINTLMQSEFDSNNISFNMEQNSDQMSIHIDKDLIELCLINLFKNAKTALENKENKLITIHAYIDYIDRKVI